jgi:hypothetical protein
VTATLSFLANNDGTVPVAVALEFSSAFVTDFDGDILPLILMPGSITINPAQVQPPGVPEPITLTLFGTGAAALIARRRSRRSR